MERELKFPCVLCQLRTLRGRELRKLGIDKFKDKYHTPRTDGLSGTLTSVLKDNLIMTTTTTDTTAALTYHPEPSKEDLLEYFSRRIRVRKMTEREALRLMDVDDADIDKIFAATVTTTRKDGTVSTKRAVSKTAAYRLAGNSIVVSCLYHIFRTMFIPAQLENAPRPGLQLSLF